MQKTLRQHLRERLRRGQAAVSMPNDDLPPAPDAGQLELAMAAAQGGRAADCEELALLLLAIDAEADSGGAGNAAEVLLGDADPVLWRRLDEAARRSWWRAPAWAQPARDRVATGQAGTLAVVVASFHPSGHVREAATARLGELGTHLRPARSRCGPATGFRRCATAPGPPSRSACPQPGNCSPSAPSPWHSPDGFMAAGWPNRSRPRWSSWGTTIWPYCSQPGCATHL